MTVDVADRNLAVVRIISGSGCAGGGSSIGVGTTLRLVMALCVCVCVRGWWHPSGTGCQPIYAVVVDCVILCTGLLGPLRSVSLAR